MSNIGIVLAAIAFIAACRFAGEWLGPRIGWDPRIAMAVLAVLGYVVVSAGVAIQRRRLSHLLSQQSPDDQEALRAFHPEFRYAKSEKSSRTGLSAKFAIWVGILWVNAPILPLMVGPLALYQVFSEAGPRLATGALLLIAGFVAAWAWWSVSVTFWRVWAHRSGVNPAELQWRGEESSLLWPEGHFFERTELGQILDRIRNGRGAA